MAFTGIHNIEVDQSRKNLVILKHLFEQNSGGLIATFGVDGQSITIYSLDAWEKFEQKLCLLASHNSRSRGIQMMLLGHACELVFNDEHDVILPRYFKEYLELKNKYIAVGQGDKLSLWNPCNFSA